MMTRECLLSLKVPARVDQLKIIRDAVAGCLSDIKESESDRLVLAVNEAVMNIIQHGYGETADGEVKIEVSTDLNTNSGVEHKEFIFRISDTAKTVDTSKIKPRDLDEIRPGGLGLHFINEVMDSVKYTLPKKGKGNILELRKTIR